MKVFSSQAEFDYSWDEVTAANWRKYSPWNEKTQHVVGVDTLSSTVDPATGVLRTERLITCQQSTPKWIQPILRGADTSLVHETSYIDPKAKTLTMCSMNLTCSNLLSVRETVIYSPSTSSPLSKTRMSQRAEITALCGGWQRVKQKIEMFSLERFQQNAAIGKEGFEMVLAKAREVFQEERQKLLTEERRQKAKA